MLSSHRYLLESNRSGDTIRGHRSRVGRTPIGSSGFSISGVLGWVLSRLARSSDLQYTADPQPHLGLNSSIERDTARAGIASPIGPLGCWSRRPWQADIPLRRRRGR